MQPYDYLAARVAVRRANRTRVNAVARTCSISDQGCLFASFSYECLLVLKIYEKRDFVRFFFEPLYTFSRTLAVYMAENFNMGCPRLMSLASLDCSTERALTHSNRLPAGLDKLSFFVFFAHLSSLKKDKRWVDSATRDAFFSFQSVLNVDGQYRLWLKPLAVYEHTVTMPIHILTSDLCYCVKDRQRHRVTHTHR